jgi:PKD repeat protein
MFSATLHSPRAAADPASGPTCISLQAFPSSDRDFYVFSVTSSGDSKTIAGYTFDFGDHESYRFMFAARTPKSRHAASTTHTYQKAGTYAVRVSLISKHGKQTHTISSNSCTATTSIGKASPNTLPDAGFSGTPGVFIGSTAAATALHHMWYRRRISKTKAAKP